MMPGFVCTFTQTATIIASMKGSFLNLFHKKMSIPLRILLITVFRKKISKYPDSISVTTNVQTQITSFCNICFIYVKVESLRSQTFQF